MLVTTIMCVQQRWYHQSRVHRPRFATRLANPVAMPRTRRTASRQRMMVVRTSNVAAVGPGPA